MIVSDRVISRDNIKLSDENKMILESMIAEEAFRQNAEASRIASEAQRTLNETARQTADSERSLAEESRNKRFETLQKEINTAAATLVSPTVTVTPTENGHQVKITDNKGEHMFSVVNGKDGKNSENYVLTDDDKKEIATAVPIVKVPSEPLFAPNLETMTDTTKAYVNTETMTFWRYQKATYEDTITDIIEDTADNPAHNEKYLNKGSLVDRVGTFVTPYIHLGEYSGQVTLKVKGTTCLSDTASNYSALDFYDENKTFIDRKYMSLAQVTGGYVVTALCDSLDKVSIDGDTTTFIIDLPRSHMGTIAHYIRFTCGTYNSGSTWETSEISITYKKVVTGYTWLDSGISYTPNVTEADKQEIVNEVVSIVDSELISIIGDGEVSV